MYYLGNRPFYLTLRFPLKLKFIFQKRSKFLWKYVCFHVQLSAFNYKFYIKLVKLEAIWRLVCACTYLGSSARKWIKFHHPHFSARKGSWILGIRMNFQLLRNRAHLVEQLSTWNSDNNRGAYNRTYSSQCMFEHRRSDVWMYSSYIGGMVHTSE